MQQDYGYLFHKKTSTPEERDETLFESILTLVVIIAFGFVLYTFYTALLV